MYRSVIYIQHKLEDLMHMIYKPTEAITGYIYMYIYIYIKFRVSDTYL